MRDKQLMGNLRLKLEVLISTKDTSSHIDWLKKNWRIISTTGAILVITVLGVSPIHFINHSITNRARGSQRERETADEQSLSRTQSAHINLKQDTSAHFDLFKLREEYIDTFHFGINHFINIRVLRQCREWLRFVVLKATQWRSNLCRWLLLWSC